MGLTRKCPDCGADMASNGEMYLDDGISTWYVGFSWCPVDEDVYPVWAPKLEPHQCVAAEEYQVRALHGVIFGFIAFQWVG